ncbi:hypothetical protein Y1Q_0023987 [Alligator mississippiensis]|uniref:Uncharacterized protein n=1 Tax=Alligator mississippiensis TaxID=8496 RepID=A0A151P963_ALLMI|nr:hypothetical protein Y1Q_0023987 [Alligator mississippiensis]
MGPSSAEDVQHQPQKHRSRSSFPMAGTDESVTYAQLKFPKPPPGQSVTPQAQGPDLGEADGTYETLQPSPVGQGVARHGVQQCRELLAGSAVSGGVPGLG